VRVYGPLFLHLYGVDEDEVIASWSMERFERYRAAADQLLEMKAR
jgi:glutamyl/glutaminyl-tRNA synthetase